METRHIIGAILGGGSVVVTMAVLTVFGEAGVEALFALFGVGAFAVCGALIAEGCW